MYQKKAKYQTIEKIIDTYKGRINIASLCGWFGISRQAYYQNKKVEAKSTVAEQIVIQEVKAIRENHKKMGTRKLYDKLEPTINEHNIKIGRDSLFNILRENNLLVKRRKSRIITTNSRHWLRKYPNLIKYITPTAPNQIWASDITYWK